MRSGAQLPQFLMLSNIHCSSGFDNRIVYIESFPSLLTPRPAESLKASSISHSSNPENGLSPISRLMSTRVTDNSVIAGRLDGTCGPWSRLREVCLQALYYMSKWGKI